MTSLNFKLTTAGQSSAIASGSLNLEITHIQLGSGHKTPDGSETNLLSPGDHSTIGGFVEVEGSPGQNKISANIGGTTAAYAISEMGLWSGVPGANNSTLVFYWSMPSGSVATKTPNVDFNVEADIYFGDATPGNITFVVDTTTSLAFLANHNASLDAHAEIINNHNNSPDAHAGLFQTPPLGDNDESVTTSAFVQGTVGGILNKSVSTANITLSKVDAGHGILVFSGNLTGNRSVIIPSDFTPTFKWIVKNNTTGNFSLTMKRANEVGAIGTGVVISRGDAQSLWANGSEVFRSSPQGCVPVGGIIMWSGSVEDIELPWALCDGTNSTPDLRHKFVVGAGAKNDIIVNPGDAGGSADSVVVAHTHGISSSSGGLLGNVSIANGFDGGSGGSSAAVNGVGSIAITNLSVSSFGETGVNKNLPPYYALAYIMRII